MSVLELKDSMRCLDVAIAINDEAELKLGARQGIECPGEAGS